MTREGTPSGYFTVTGALPSHVLSVDPLSKKLTAYGARDMNETDS